MIRSQRRLLDVLTFSIISSTSELEVASCFQHSFFSTISHHRQGQGRLPSTNARPFHHPSSSTICQNDRHDNVISCQPTAWISTKLFDNKSVVMEIARVEERKLEIEPLSTTSLIDSSFTDEEITYEKNEANEEQRDDGMIYLMLGLIFMVGSLAALDRVAMSVALVPLSEEMGYTDGMKGSISSLFSVGYGLGILPCGLLLAYLSPRLVIATGVALWSVGTIATPYAADLTSLDLLLFVRAVVGIGESVVLPSIQRLLSNWIPRHRKSLAVATVYAGFQSGTCLAYLLSPIVIDACSSWRALFYTYGGFGLVFLIPWILLARDAPGHSIASKNQQLQLQPEFERNHQIWENVGNVLKSAPWKEFSKSKGVWAMLLAHSANNFVLYTNLSWSPSFYAEKYGLQVRDSAILLVTPAIFGAICGLVAGSLAESMIQKLGGTTDETVTQVRKFFQGIALYGPALCLATLAWHVPDEPWVAQSLLTVSVGLQAFNAAGYGAANQEKAGEKWTGLLYSITSLPSVMVGTLAVYVTGQILDLTHQDWSYVFCLSSCAAAVGATAFVVLYESRREFD